MTFRALAATILALASLLAAPAMAAKPDPVLVIATPDGSHVIDRASARVKVVEYVSYTCPHCAAFEKEGADTILLMLVRPGKVSMEYPAVPAQRDRRRRDAVGQLWPALTLSGQSRGGAAQSGEVAGRAIRRADPALV